MTSPVTPITGETLYLAGQTMRVLRETALGRELTSDEAQRLAGELNLMAPDRILLLAYGVAGNPNTTPSANPNTTPSAAPVTTGRFRLLLLSGALFFPAMAALELLDKTTSLTFLALDVIAGSVFIGALYIAGRRNGHWTTARSIFAKRPEKEVSDDA
jgi:hypothetical protein